MFFTPRCAMFRTGLNKVARISCSPFYLQGHPGRLGASSPRPPGLLPGHPVAHADRDKQERTEPRTPSKERRYHSLIMQ